MGLEASGIFNTKPPIPTNNPDTTDKISGTKIASDANKGWFLKPLSIMVANRSELATVAAEYISDTLFWRSESLCVGVRELNLSKTICNKSNPMIHMK